jgi:hypothetical protein
MHLKMCDLVVHTVMRCACNTQQAEPMLNQWRHDCPHCGLEGGEGVGRFGNCDTDRESPMVGLRQYTAHLAGAQQTSI